MAKSKQFMTFLVMATGSILMMSCAELDPPAPKEPVAVDGSSKSKDDRPATPPADSGASKEKDSVIPAGFALFTDGKYQLLCRKAEPIELQALGKASDSPVKDLKPEGLQEAASETVSTSDVTTSVPATAEVGLPAQEPSVNLQVKKPETVSGSGSVTEAVQTPGEAAPDVVSQKPSASDDGAQDGLDQATYTVTTSWLNVRSAPSMNSKVIKKLKKGDIVQARGREGIWVQVGENGYVSLHYLKESHKLSEK